jgi:hypothetical protein
MVHYYLPRFLLGFLLRIFLPGDPQCLLHPKLGCFHLDRWGLRRNLLFISDHRHAADHGRQKPIANS